MKINQNFSTSAFPRLPSYGNEKWLLKKDTVLQGEVLELDFKLFNYGISCLPVNRTEFHSVLN